MRNFGKPKKEEEKAEISKYEEKKTVCKKQTQSSRTITVKNRQRLIKGESISLIREVIKNTSEEKKKSKKEIFEVKHLKTEKLEESEVGICESCFEKLKRQGAFEGSTHTLYRECRKEWEKVESTRNYSKRRFHALETNILREETNSFFNPSKRKKNN